jgi:hypothetical protein
MPGRQSQQEPQPVPPRGDVPGGGVESQPGNCAAVDAEPCWPLDARDPAGDGPDARPGPRKPATVPPGACSRPGCPCWPQDGLLPASSLTRSFPAASRPMSGPCTASCRSARISTTPSSPVFRPCWCPPTHLPRSRAQWPRRCSVLSPHYGGGGRRRGIGAPRPARHQGTLPRAGIDKAQASLG